ncbi:sigma factor-like helix-turn-helix DNA-binding protein [Niabella aurantiaca]|uniref:sigma-70 region 4 domain-containing protein n=1 Tax=Niabella aurantiaca TaxID=379900 RepID=UPI00037B9737|nr:sigma-70 region 4 domain-containing protein [Niabella aurantiaca]
MQYEYFNVQLNNNKQRDAYWEYLCGHYSDEEMEKALATLKPDAAKVLDLHCRNRLSFKEIARVMNKSVSVVRNHYTISIFRLYAYFNPRVFDKIPEYSQIAF